MEVWVPIVDFPDYEISSWGRVRRNEVVDSYYTTQTDRLVTRVRKARMIQTIICPNGRVVVSLFNKNGKCRKYVHRLIAVGFMPNPSSYSVINHIDANPTNNSIPNLEWCDTLHNVMHAFKLGTRSNKGTKNSMSKLTEADVRDIRRIYKAGGISQSKLATIYNVRQSCVGKVITRARWKHIEEEI